MVRVTQRYDYVSLEDCGTEDFQAALTAAIASGMGLAAGNVMYETAAANEESDSSVDITYTIMQTGSNVDQIAASLKGLAVTYAVMEGLASAGYPNAVASSDAVTLEDVSATLAPTAMPTVSMAVLRVTMRITSATQKDAGNDEFISALQQGIADAAGIEPTGVVFIIAAAANGGESVDVAFSVRSEGVNVKALSAIVSSEDTKAKVQGALAKAGYDASEVNGTPTVVNLSPTAFPTAMPTMKLTVVRVMQRVVGATLENADYEAFRTAIVKGITQATGAPDGSITFDAAEETEDGNGIYVVYTVRSSGFNSEWVLSTLNAGTSSAAVTQTLKQAGFGTCAMEKGVLEYSDISPSARPTFKPSMRMAVLQGVQRVAGCSIYDAAKSDFKLALEKGVAASLGMAGLSQVTVDFVTASTSSFGQAIDITYTISAPSVTMQDLMDTVQSAVKRDELTSTLKNAGYVKAAADPVITVNNISPTEAPTMAPTMKYVVVQGVQRIDKVAESQVKTKEFVLAFQTAIADALGLGAENVVYAGVTKSKVGEACDVVFMVSAMQTSASELSARIKTETTMAAMTQYIGAAGFESAYAAEAATVNDVSPTGAPSPMPTLAITIVQSVQRIDGLMAQDANTPVFTSAFKKTIAESAGVHITDVTIVAVKASLMAETAVDVTYNVQAPNTNVESMAELLRGVQATAALTLAINKAGFPSAQAVVEASIKGLSPTTGPTALPARDLAVLKVTQRVTGISYDDANNRDFMAQIEKAVASVAHVPAGDVTVKSVATFWEGVHMGDGVDVEYEVQAPSTSSDVVYAAITGNLEGISANLQTAYPNVEASEKTSMTDISPTPVPTSMPTQGILTLEVHQKINGVTDLDVQEDDFRNAFLKATATAVGVEYSQVVLISYTVSYNGQNPGVEVTYQITAENMSPETLLAKLHSDYVSNVVLKAIQTAGYTLASRGNGEMYVTDLSPTIAPTPYPTKSSAVLGLSMRFDGVTAAMANDPALQGAMMKAISTMTEVPADHIVFGGAQLSTASADGMTMIFRLNTVNSNPDMLKVRMQSPDVADKITELLFESGYPTVTVGGNANVVDSSPTYSPTARPTQPLVVVQSVQRVDGVSMAAYAANSATFQAAVKEQVAASLKISSDDVTVLGVAENKVEGLDVTYLVSMKQTSLSTVSDVLESVAHTQALTTGLVAAGFTAAFADSKAITGDVTPTAMPTPKPSWAYNVLKVLQKIDGVTLAQAQDATFNDAVLQAVARSIEVDAADMTVESVKEKVGGGVDFLYTIYATDKNVADLTSLIKSKTMTGESVATGLQTAGFTDAYVSTDSIVWDLTPSKRKLRRTGSQV